jgi:hypothetical protein
MAGLNDAGMHGADRNLMQPLAMHGQEGIVGRVAQGRACSAAERAFDFPGAVIKPGTVVFGAFGHIAVKIVDRPLQPDGGGMPTADRRKAVIDHDSRDDAGVFSDPAQRHMHHARLRPQAEQLALALPDHAADLVEYGVVDLVTRPWLE